MPFLLLDESSNSILTESGNRLTSERIYHYFAEINGSNIVQQVIVAEPNFISSGELGAASKWKETFYHGEAGKYAGKGFTWNSGTNQFN